MVDRTSPERYMEQRAGEALGRFPANVILSHDPRCVETVEEWACVPGCAVRMLDDQSGTSRSVGGRIGKKATSNVNIVPAGNFQKGDPGYGDSGGASRFFYTAKPAKSEKNAGAEDVEWTNPETGKVMRGNVHPTCKPVALMRYLCRLVTPPGGIVLDPFMGSGTTGVAALQEGFNFAGIERDPRRPEDVPSFHIARARIEHAARKLAEQTPAGGSP